MPTIFMTFLDSLDWRHTWNL